jgi:signal transduction histidine kinase
MTRISQSADQMERLLSDLLEYSKISQADLQLEAVNLQVVVREALALAETDIRTHNAEITLADSFPTVLAHPATVTLLVQNLISNGIKFSAPNTQPKINISAEQLRADARGGNQIAQTEAVASSRVEPRNSGFVRLWVSDNGIGIPAEEIQKLFVPFQRLNSPRLYPGTGLGLAIVRKGAERMGGRVGVESKPGKGSRFWIELRSAAETTK